VLSRFGALAPSSSCLTTMPTPLQALHHPYTRYGAIFFSVILTLHLLASFSSPTYSSTTAAARARLGLGGDEIGASHYYKGQKTPAGWSPADYAAGNELSTLESGGGNGTRANAAFVVLARNSDVWEILSSIRGMEGALFLGSCRLVSSLERMLTHHSLQTASIPAITTLGCS
jgi:hypothetical protein